MARETVETHFGRKADHYDRASWVQNRELLTWAQDAIGFSAARTIVDIGGGTGVLASHLRDQNPHVNVINLDISMAMSMIASRKGLQCVVADAGLLPIGTTAADAVILRQVLHYVDCVESALAECWRILKPKGIIIVNQFVPRDKAEMAVMQIVRIFQPVRKRVLTTDQLTQQLSHAGFQGHSISKIQIDEPLYGWLERHNASSFTQRLLQGLVRCGIHAHITPLRFVITEAGIHGSASFVCLVGAKK
jgi:ubiquinone/menaquinone biosynthesis C-methylase UbiE